MKLEEIEKKLNSFNDKLNSLGSELADNLNVRISKVDSVINSKVSTLDDKVDSWSKKHNPIVNESCKSGSVSENLDNLQGIGNSDVLTGVDIIKPALEFVEKEDVKEEQKGVNLKKN